MKRDESGEILPSREELEGSAFDELSAGLTDMTITRGRAIKLAGAALLGGALTVLWADEADAGNKKKRRRRRRKRRNAVTATPNPVVLTPSQPTASVTITNNGMTPVTIDPQLVGDGFTLDLSGLGPGDLTLVENGGSVTIPVTVDPLELGDSGKGVLNILDDIDGLVLEVIELDATGLLPDLP